MPAKGGSQGGWEDREKFEVVQSVASATESSVKVESKGGKSDKHGKNEEHDKHEKKEGMCGGGSGTHGCTSVSGSKLLPVLDSGFNLREICKQCVLLEDHLFQKDKGCYDCIVKHFLTIEGLAEEAVTLDKTNKYNLGELNLPERIRALERRFIENKEDTNTVAQELRQIRKPLMVQYFDKF